MTQDILIAPGSGEPYIKFIASGVNDTVSAVNLKIAQIAVYSKALSHGEIKQNYNATKGRFA